MNPRAVIVRQFGAPDTYALEPHDPGPPGPGQVRIAVYAVGVSFVDVLTARGAYQVRPPLPFIPGSEFAGVIAAVGEGVAATRVGERVCASAFGGVLAEAAVVPAEAALAIPEAMSFEDASIFWVSYATAYYALAIRGGLKQGERLCVLGAAGAVGYAAVQVGKALGAQVIASASTPEKRAFALAGGADHAIEARAADWRDQLKAACAGVGPDVVLDPLGGAFTEPAFRSLAWNGRHLVVGFAAGDIPRLATNLALLKGAALIGVDIRQFGLKEPADSAAVPTALMALYDVGRLRPPVGPTYPLERFREALDDAGAGRTVGRVVIRLQPD